jgi:hypothetical protein
MDDFNAAGDRQYFPRAQRLVYPNRLNSLVGMKEPSAHNLP